MMSELKQNGYVALLSVLVLSAIATTVAVTLLLTGTDSSREVLVVQQSAIARSYADACADEALQLIHDSTTYTGTGNLTLAHGSCSYTVTSTGASTRTISAAATVGNATRKVAVYVTISSTISINSWQEVS